MTSTETVKGFKDFTGKEAEKRVAIHKLLVETFEKYGFEPAETPIIEREEFVKGSDEQQGDEAVSDIFKLRDKGKRKLALRYEFTFQLKRLAKNKKLPYKRYQIGEVFRDEPTSAEGARFRQFTQCDIDVVGSGVREEAECLSVVNEIFKQLFLKPEILINNRKLLNEILDDQDISSKANKEKVLRELDKFDKLPLKEVQASLKKIGAGNLLASLKKGEKYFKRFQSYKEIISLMDYCRSYGFKPLFSPTIVRGLSYYNGSVFEVKVKGFKETIVAGGSYLINDIQSTGLSFGLDRLTLISKVKPSMEKYMIISLERDRQAIKLAGKLRSQGKNVIIYYGKPSKALSYANSQGIRKVIFVGNKEVKAKKFKVKDMTSGKESLLSS